MTVIAHRGGASASSALTTWALGTAALGTAALAICVLSPSSARAEVDANGRLCGMQYVNGQDLYYGPCAAGPSRPAQRSVRPAIPDCMIAQNAMRPCAPAPAPTQLAGVDPRIVGTWIATINGGPWVWRIASNGTYRFYSEAGDGTPPHQGTFAAKDGRWALRATTGLPGWFDGGGYAFNDADAFTIAGRLGSSVWRRSAPPR